MACSMVDRIKRSLDKIENGRYSELSIQQCVDKIDWLARWKKVPEDVWVPLCEQATRILDAETNCWRMQRKRRSRYIN